MHTLFVLFDAPDATISAVDLNRVAGLLSEVPGLAEALLLTPTAGVGDQPFAADGRGAALALQLDYASEEAMTASLAGDGPLAILAQPDALPSLAGAQVSHQPMIGRSFPVQDPHPRPGPSGLPLTFLVQYPGKADNLPAWLDHYDANHPPIMVRFPGIRAVSTFRPIEAWETRLPWARNNAMQRNKVVFDSAEALVVALASSVMDEMRADGATFPAYRPRATHHPMDTRRVVPA